MPYFYSKISSPVGPLHLLADTKKIVALIFDNNWRSFKSQLNADLVTKKNQIILKTEKQLAEYFSGKRIEFTVDVDLNGTEFQKQAWKTLCKIPYGKTISYGEQAKIMKNPKAVRAVGGANGKNKICIIIPCHRVIGQNGSLTGFGGGIKIKKQLLELEKAAFC